MIIYGIDDPFRCDVQIRGIFKMCVCVCDFIPFVFEKNGTHISGICDLS